ncbi:Polyprenol-phosphate-mannose-dependent alpha-(1-2)-phosphatidylinositol mannoside mannosyltransferase [Caballeronia terrestris]|uniref:Polyprenol-phosphate-mannose-dependent alpha-(1-2)-phosphatidylinositol mannoside mannosyltransferase n=1 Tax=Caballeronia terrestris TaxID=1226301 RepID=A0A158KKE8_9BURK|nr:glycosyltransferase family 87 protein [Caballeronia terrestris]SAL81223.1 Polyprenol-phosphate-mannose-dependent alpha-(1-2)-phosphatidylinositol mannoside mannosyltransferase [Caballeronia terrestris]
MLNARVGARTQDNVRIIAVLLVLVAMVFLAIRVVIIYHFFLSYRANQAEAFSDFNLYYYAFNVVLHSPHDPSLLYDNNNLLVFLKAMGADPSGFGILYCYPPQFALVFSPFGLMSPLAAKLAWVAMSLGLCIIGVILTAKMAYRGSERRIIALLIAIVLLSFPVLHDGYLGQSNELLFFLLATSFYLIERKHPYAAGSFLALAVVFKVTPLAIVGLLLLRREWRAVVSTIVWAIALSLFTATQLGFRVIWHYITVDVSRANAQILTMGGLPGNSSVRGTLQTLSENLGMPASESVLHATSTGFALIVCMLACYLVFRRSQDRRMDYALACITMLLASPVLEPIHMVVALLPLVIVIGTALEQLEARLSAIAPRAELLLAAIAVLLLFFLERSATYAASAFIIYVLCVARYFPRSTILPRDSRARLGNFNSHTP